ncbi:hypothetical protein [Chitinophaga sancti]|uniref:hypothetical protein n=1 Tax=Chitinophaga sancti TaxID=1004 RepID=UPI003F7A2D23
MDKNVFQDMAAGGCTGVLKSAADEPFNGWFLMKTPQVSTGGVYFLINESDWKIRRSCNKIAVIFFSLHAGYPVLKIDLTPSKYKFMKNAFLTAFKGRSSIPVKDRDGVKRSLVTVKTAFTN